MVFTHLLQQRIELGGLADLEVTRLDGVVVDTEDHVDRVHRLGSDVGKLLDLGGGVLDLVMISIEILGRSTGRQGDVLTCSSVSCKLSCSTRDLTAFQPVNRCLLRKLIRPLRSSKRSLAHPIDT